MSNIHEECGVFGVYANESYDIASTVYYGLYALQHRGQESCGIVVNDDGLFTAYKDTGLVNDVFTTDHLNQFGQGNIAIGHVRYGTTGGSARDNAQPIVVNHINGHIALAHNGNLTNSYELRSALELKGSIFHTTSDTEVISYIITEERLTAPSIEEAVNRAVNRIKGAYSLVVMSPTKMIAVRDEMGFRPLCIGRLPENGGYVVASESCALDAVGAPGGPLVKNFADAKHLGHARDEDVEVAAEAVFQRGGLEELGHQLFGVHAALEVEGELEAVQVGLIPHVGDLLDLSGFDQLCHLVHDDFRGGGVGNFRDFNEIAVLDVAPFCPEPEASTACGIDFPCGGLVKQQLRAGGEIRAGQGFQNVMVRIFHQGDGGVADLPEVKGANIAGHTNGNALIGRHQHIGKG